MSTPTSRLARCAPRCPSAPSSLVLGLVLSAAIGCTPSPEQAQGSAARTALDLSNLEVVDLSHTYDASTLYWPTTPHAFELDQLARGETELGYFYSAYSFRTPEHGGTHIDAPVHFYENGAAVDEIPLDELILAAVVIDVSGSTEGNPDYRLTLADIETWEAENGEIPAASAVLLRTGWSQFWPDAKKYLGDDTPGDASKLHFPSFGVEAARFLVEQRGARLLGIDTASIDYGASNDFAVHQVVGTAGVPALENLTNLDRLPLTGAWIVALPMKIGGGSGGPVRVAALIASE